MSKVNQINTAVKKLVRKPRKRRVIVAGGRAERLWLELLGSDPAVPEYKGRVKFLVTRGASRHQAELMSRRHYQDLSGWVKKVLRRQTKYPDRPPLGWARGRKWHGVRVGEGVIR